MSEPWFTLAICLIQALSGFEIPNRSLVPGPLPFGKTPPSADTITKALTQKLKIEVCSLRNKKDLLTDEIDLRAMQQINSRGRPSALLQ